MIAPTRRTEAIGSGIPFEVIYTIVLSKPFIFSGMAEINFAVIDTREKKSKKDFMIFKNRIFHCFCIKQVCSINKNLFH
tara:strand:+ start:599 stop:835 length:237 start_codon:yes stop_codon:yes gene_type:complete